MASNSFGEILRVTTWGESHGMGIGAVIDGFPAGVELLEEELSDALLRRSPGKSVYTSPRVESDRGRFLSGVFEGKSTGSPIAIWIENTGSDSKPYQDAKTVFRPGHASFTYMHKYGHWDYRGGGRASARETVARVAAGYCVKKWLQSYGVQISSWISQVGSITLPDDWCHGKSVHKAVSNAQAHLFCPEETFFQKVQAELNDALQEGDSRGGVVSCHIDGVPVGLGEPVYEKIEAKLAYAMLGIPASKGFEIGGGFQAAYMKGSEYIDGFCVDSDRKVVRPSTNRSGGTLAGISTGETISFRVAFKPTSSIRIPIESVDTLGNVTAYTTAKEGKHDPCVAIRAVPVVEAMAFLVLGDLFALSSAFSLSSIKK